MKRIDSFLAEPEVPDWASTLTASVTPLEPDMIGFSQATFKWEEESDGSTSRFNLGPLDFAFPKGQLTLISGATGSGKSALLAALLGGIATISLSKVILNYHSRDALYIRQGLS
jgi:ABC-type transport system involved in cytochrome bd biosynthesis fused ATPase/permease subunit